VLADNGIEGQIVTREAPLNRSRRRANYSPINLGCLGTPTGPLTRIGNRWDWLRVGLLRGNSGLLHSLVFRKYIALGTWYSRFLEPQIPVVELPLETLMAGVEGMGHHPILSTSRWLFIGSSFNFSLTSATGSLDGRKYSGCTIQQALLTVCGSSHRKSRGFS